MNARKAEELKRFISIVNQKLIGLQHEIADLQMKKEDLLHELRTLSHSDATFPWRPAPSAMQNPPDTDHGPPA